MKKLDLNEREFGGWFAPFERELLFVKKEEHIGWVEHTSDKTFKLKLTPFYEQYRNYEYIAPESNLLPLQNSCVEVTPFKITREPVFNDKSLYGNYQNYCIIDGFKEYTINIKDHKPDIGFKDFLYQCSVQWKNAEEEDIDKMLALQLVSCPSSFYGKGGIGTMASKLSSHGKLSNIVPNLNSTYNSIMATNFQKMNDKYFFKMIKTPRESKFINHIRQSSNSCEINYCNPCLTINEAQTITESVPIQIPLLIKNATYKATYGLAEPYLLLQYQLTALMHEPKFGDTNSALNKIENNIRKTIEERKNIINVDANTINKLALSFSRLYLNDDTKTEDINEATDMFFAHLNDWKPYINQSKELSRFRNDINPQDTHVKFSHDHQKFLVELQKLHDETNEKWIALAELEKKFDIKKRNSVNDIALDLNNLGLIIQQYNFSKIRKVDIEP